MKKKQHYQGFRKFSIKTRLVIALLMISIIHWQASAAIHSTFFRKRFAKAFYFHFTDSFYDQSEYGK